MAYEYMNQTQNNPNISGGFGMPEMPSRPAPPSMPSFPSKSPTPQFLPPPSTGMAANNSGPTTSGMGSGMSGMGSMTGMGTGMSGMGMSMGGMGAGMSPGMGGTGMGMSMGGGMPTAGAGMMGGATSTGMGGRMSVQGPPPVMGIEYIPGFLAKNIGRFVRAEFIVGTTQFIDRQGILLEVGVNYFVLQDIITKSTTMCDLYSVRFVTFLT